MKSNLTPQGIAHSLVSFEKVHYVTLPNLFKSGEVETVKEEIIIVTVCGDCKEKQPEKANQFCKCGAKLYPF